MVSAERCLVSLRGSGSPVNGATGPGFTVVVVKGVEVVVEVEPLAEVVEVVVVESVDAPDDHAKLEPKPMTIKNERKRRIEAT